MGVADRHKILYLVEVLLMTFDLATCVTSLNQGAGDVWFSLRNRTYQNNSIVILEDIGEGGDALLCKTNLTACCRRSYTGSNIVLGNWFFPNGTRVPSSEYHWDFHRTRGHMVVQIHRRRGGEEGIYSCQIPDTVNVTQTIYIGVYSASTGFTSTVSCSHIQPTNTLQSNGATITIISNTIKPTNTLQSNGATITIISNTIQPTNTFQSNGATITVISSIQPTNVSRSDRAIKVVCTRPINNSQSDGTTAIPVSSSSRTMPTNTHQNGKVTTTLVIVVATVAIILLIITVGFIILVILFKKRKQQLEINKLQNVTAENDNIKLKQQGTTEKESTTEECLNQNSTFIGEYSEIKVIPGEEEEDNLDECNQNDTFIGEYSEIEVVPGEEEEDNLEECNQNDTFFGEYSEIKVVPGEEEKDNQSEECLNQDDTFIGEYSEIKVIPGEEEDNQSEECLNQDDKLIGEYSEIEVVPAESEYTLHANPSRHVHLSNITLGKMESKPMYQSMEQCCDSPSYTNVPQGTASDDTYTTPAIASSQTVEADNYEAEPINPSLFLGKVRSPSESHNLQPYAPIYTGHTTPSSKQHSKNSFSSSQPFAATKND